MTDNVVFLRSVTTQEALDVLITTFDISDISPGESQASIDYNQSRIDVAREALKQNPNERERIIYGAWLDFFQEKTDEARLGHSAKQRDDFYPA